MRDKAVPLLNMAISKRALNMSLQTCLTYLLLFFHFVYKVHNDTRSVDVVYLGKTIFIQFVLSVSYIKLSLTAHQVTSLRG